MNPYWPYYPHPPLPYPPDPYNKDGYWNANCDWHIEEERQNNKALVEAADTVIKNSFDLVYGTDQWSLPSTSSSSLNQRRRTRRQVAQKIIEGQNFDDKLLTAVPPPPPPLPANRFKCDCTCGGCGNSEKFQKFQISQNFQNSQDSHGSSPSPSSASASSSSVSSEENEDDDDAATITLAYHDQSKSNAHDASVAGSVATLTGNGNGNGPQTSMLKGPINYGTVVNNQSSICQDLVNWLNGWLAASYVHVEELCDGAAYCQFMDMLCPGSVPMHKVKFQTRLEHEYIHNFKILQRAFQKIHVDKRVPIVKLVQGDFGEGFAFLQWFKNFFDMNYKGQPYNAFEARGRMTLGGHHLKIFSPQNSSPFVTNTIGQQIMYQDMEESQHHAQLKCVGTRHRQCCGGGWFFSYPDD